MKNEIIQFLKEYIIGKTLFTDDVIYLLVNTDSNYSRNAEIGTAAKSSPQKWVILPESVVV